MINTPLNIKKSQGAITFIITTILIFLITLIILFAASYNIMQQKTSANEYRATQAFAAAQAGIDFGIVYLQQNSATILANPVSGHLAAFSNSSTTNVNLADGSKYSFTYTNPTANNYKLITITSTGTSSDGSATRIISQQVMFGSILVKSPSVPLISKGSITLAGSGTVQNSSGTTTMQSASTVSLSGSSQTINQSGIASTPGHISSDIQQSVSSLSSQSQNDFFATYFGTSSSNIKNSVTNYYTNASSTNYSSTLNGMTGNSIWIDQTSGTATINGNTTIGSTTNPVLLIINGQFSMSGTVTIHGFIFVIGTSGITSTTGNITIDGALMTTDNLSISGSSNVTYNPTVLTNLQSQSGMLYYARVPGSWKDF